MTSLSPFCSIFAAFENRYQSADHDHLKRFLSTMSFLLTDGKTAKAETLTFVHLVCHVTLPFRLHDRIHDLFPLSKFFLSKTAVCLIYDRVSRLHDRIL